MTDLKLEITPNGECTFRTGSAPAIFQYDGFQYCADSTDSFCRLLKAKAKSVTDAVVFEKDTGFYAIVDTRVEDRRQDSISYKFELSSLATEWEKILAEGEVFTVKRMIDFLKRREPGEIDDIETFMFAAQNFRYVVKTEGDFTRDNNQNYVFAIKVGEAEGTVKVPERIYANIALHRGSDFVQSVEIEVDIHRPKDEKDGSPGFFLSCPKFQRYLDKARDNEVGILERELREFLVVQGSAK
jgi:hypothetical protein